MERLTFKSDRLTFPATDHDDRKRQRGLEMGRVLLWVERVDEVQVRRRGGDSDRATRVYRRIAVRLQRRWPSF
jgi:hypothetical protein